MKFSHLIQSAKHVVNRTANVVTIGGVDRLDNSRSKYDAERKRYEETVVLAKVECIKTNATKEELVQIREKAIELLRRAERTLSHYNSNLCFNELKRSQCSEINPASSDLPTSMSLDAIPLTSATSLALSGGSWVLVSHFGVASTGAAISSLSGAAATNATLAWFGGGSIATGGVGMAGGIAVLGSFFIAPIVVFAAFSTHSTAKKIDHQLVNLQDQHKNLTGKLAELRRFNNSFTSKKFKVHRAYCDLRDAEYQMKQEFERFGFLSRSYTAFRRLFDKNWRTAKELEYSDRLNERRIEFYLTWNCIED